MLECKSPHTVHVGAAGQSYITLQLLYIKGIQDKVFFYTLENSTNMQRKVQKKLNHNQPTPLTSYSQWETCTPGVASELAEGTR